MTETLGNTPSNVEAEILFDALAFKLFDRESKTVKIHSGRCDDRGTLLAYLYKKNGLECTNHDNERRLGTEE